MSTRTPPGPDSPLQGEKKYKQMLQHLLLVLIVWKGALRREIRKTD